MDPRKALTILGLVSPRDLLEGRGSPREPERERSQQHSVVRDQHSVDTLGYPLAGCSAPSPGLKVIWLQRNPSSPLSSLALRTSSDTRRTELRRAARSPLGTSKRTKYSRWGLPARGLWAGRVSKWWILASNVFGSKSRKKGEGGETNGEGAMETDGRVQWRETMRDGER